MSRERVSRDFSHLKNFKCDEDRFCKAADNSRYKIESCNIQVPGSCSNQGGELKVFDFCYGCSHQ